MTADLCPQCGAPRQAGNRFCGSCAFDFWKAAEAPPEQSSAGPPTPPVAPSQPTVAWHPDSKPPRSNLRIVLIVLGVLGVLAVIGVLNNPAGSPTAESSPTSYATPRPTATPRPSSSQLPTPTPLVCGPNEHVSLDECVANTPPPPTPPPPTPKSYATMSDRDWALLVKAPDDYTGRAIQMWACITQFDAATGTDTFRGQANNLQIEYWYSDGDNALFTGTTSQLAPFVQDDVVYLKVVVLGSYTYDTQIGGSTTVPWFSVDEITNKGSCA